jgi:hypothetical protein
MYPVNPCGPGKPATTRVSMRETRNTVLESGQPNVEEAGGVKGFDTSFPEIIV